MGFRSRLLSGYLRHYFLIRELSEHHEISLFSIVGGDFDNADSDALTPYTKRIRTFPSSSRWKFPGAKGTRPRALHRGSRGRGCATARPGGQGSRTPRAV